MVLYARIKGGERERGGGERKGGGRGEDKERGERERGWPHTDRNLSGPCVGEVQRDAVAVNSPVAETEL